MGETKLSPFSYTMNQSKNWYEIVQGIEIIHRKKSEENPGWTQDDTCRVTGYSRGYVSESLKLAAAVKANPKLSDCADRETALGKIRPGNESFSKNDRVLVRIGNTFESGTIIGRGTILPRDTVYIVKLDMPFFFERASRRMDTIIVKSTELKELDV